MTHYAAAAKHAAPLYSGTTYQASGVTIPPSPGYGPSDWNGGTGTVTPPDGYSGPLARTGQDHDFIVALALALIILGAILVAARNTRPRHRSFR